MRAGATEAHELENGIELILHKDESAPLVYFLACQDVSAADDPPGKTGLAHLVEHLESRGLARERPYELSRNSRADTDFDSTCYHQKLPADQIEFGLWLLRQRLVEAPTISPQRFEAERRSVELEITERFESRRDVIKWRAIRAALFPELEPWGFFPVGKVSDLRRLTPEDASNFIRQWYRPAGTRIVIAGDFDRDLITQRLHQWLADIPQVALPTPRRPRPSDRLEHHRRAIDLPAGLEPSLAFAWRAPGPIKPGESEAAILAAILGTVRGGRLNHAFRAAGVGAAINLTFESEMGVGSFVVQVIPEAASALAVAEKVLDDVFVRLMREPITAEDHAAAIAAVVEQRAAALDSLADRATALQRHARHLGRVRGSLEEDQEEAKRLQRTTPKSVLEAARTLFTPRHRVELVFQATGHGRDDRRDAR